MYYESLRYKWSVPFKRKWLQFKLNMGLVSQVDYRHRGIGKTTMLVNRALYDGVPIVVGSFGAYQYIKSFSQENPVRVLIATPYTVPNFEQEYFPKGVYVDESLAAESLQLMKDRFEVRILGGFRQ